MERIAHSLLVHLLDEQAHGLHHDHTVAGLDRDDHVAEVLIATDAEELHA